MIASNSEEIRKSLQKLGPAFEKAFESLPEESKAKFIADFTEKPVRRIVKFITKRK